MKETFLEKILVKTRDRVARTKELRQPSQVRSQAESVRAHAIHHRFSSALSHKDRVNIIAEIKRASPSKGVINSEIDVRSLARSYESGGAAAISVLTEGEYFGGSIDDLTAVAQTASIPVLRKDFIIDEFQIYEAAAAGSDGILLIAAAMTENQLAQLLNVAEGDLGMDALVEVHTADEIEIAKNVGAKVIGVNNRDLRSLIVSLDVSRRLIADGLQGAIMISESGINSCGDIAELRSLGFNAFLIGEALMRSGDAVGRLLEFTAAREAV